MTPFIGGVETVGDVVCTGRGCGKVNAVHVLIHYSNNVLQEIKNFHFELLE